MEAGTPEITAVLTTLPPLSGNRASSFRVARSQPVREGTIRVLAEAVCKQPFIGGIQKRKTDPNAINSARTTFAKFTRNCCYA